MTTFDEWIQQQLTTDGLYGTVRWNEDEQAHVLEQKGMDIGLTEPFWTDYENKKVRIRIEVVKEE